LVDGPRIELGRNAILQGSPAPQCPPPVKLQNEDRCSRACTGLGLGASAEPAVSWRQPKPRRRQNHQNKKPSAGYAREGSNDLPIMLREIYPLELLPGPRRSRKFSGMPCPNATAWNGCREPGFRHGRPLRGAAAACVMVAVLIMGRGLSHSIGGSSRTSLMIGLAPFHHPRGRIAAQAIVSSGAGDSPPLRRITGRRR